MRFGSKSRLGHSILALAMIVSLTAILPSCLKEKAVQPGDRKMIIAFNWQSVPYEKIDSAAAVFTKQGTTTPYYLRFQKQNGNFEVSMADFTTGIWKIEVMAYSKKDTAGKSFEYTTWATMDVGQISGVLLGAPDQNASGIWKKHIVLSSPTNDVVSITPLDLTNPAFTLIAKDPRWDSFYVKKTAYLTFAGDTSIVSDKVWSCSTNCLGTDRILSDTTYFNDFAQYLKTHNWDKGSVEVRFTDKQSSETKAFMHYWNK